MALRRQPRPWKSAVRDSIRYNAGRLARARWGSGRLADVVSGRLRPSFFQGNLLAWYDFSNPATLWLDTARTSPASGAAGESIAGVTDLSGNGYHLEQATAASRPVTEIVNGSLRLQFDGVADTMSSVAALNFGGSDAVTISAGLNKASDASSTRCIVEIGNTGSINGSTGLFGPRVAAEPGFVFHSRGTANAESGVTTGYPAPFKGVVTGIGDISADTAIMRIDGTQVASVATDQGTGGFATSTMWVGSRGGTQWFFSGSLGSLFVLRSVATDRELAAIRAFNAAAVP